MKAIVYRRYGPPDNMELKEVEKPTPKDHEALIKVHASSVNSWDWDMLRGIFPNRLISGLLKPKIKILGLDIAGRVEAVGSNVDQLQPGDEVFGDISGSGWGGFAGYVCADEKVLALKPASMTFEEAAAIPQAAVLALQGLRDKKQILPGHKVLINGAGGGVGTFAIQIAKMFRAEVTAVDSAKKLDKMHSLGADHVIDYKQGDFIKNGKQYDLILDVVGSRSISEYLRVLNSNGAYVMVGGPMALIFQALLLGAWISITGSKKMGILAHEPNKKDLDYLAGLFEAGKVAPVIDKLYPLSDVPEAIRYVEGGHAVGKVVITI